MSVSFDKAAPLSKCDLVDTSAPWASFPFTNKRCADFSLLPALAHSSMKALIPSRDLVPSTTIHSRSTWLDVRGNGCTMRPLQAGHHTYLAYQWHEIEDSGYKRSLLRAGHHTCRAYPGLGALFPSGAWSIIHCANTFIGKYVIDQYWFQWNSLRFRLGNLYTLWNWEADNHKNILIFELSLKGRHLRIIWKLVNAISKTF